MKEEKKPKIVNHNYQLGNLFLNVPFRLIFRWIMILVVVGAFVNLIAFPVKIYSDIDCSSGDFNLAFEHLLDNETKELEPQYITLNGIEDMNCKAKIRVDIPLIGLLFV